MMQTTQRTVKAKNTVIPALGFGTYELTGSNCREMVEAAIDGLREVARQKRGRSLKLQEIDGEPARKSPLASRLLAAGFRVDLQGLILMETPA